MLVDQSVRSLLDAFRSSDPTPGGGSASALASAIGASLLLMVAAMPKSRNGSDDDRAALNAASTTLGLLRSKLTDAIDADTAAYNQVVAAYRLPKATPEEQAARKSGIQLALRRATDVPLSVMEQSVRALEAATIVAERGYRSAASDVGVAIALLNAGTTGAKLNVDVNLEAVTDSAYRERATAAARDLLAEAGALAGRGEALLR
jgi:formiminotetrahydrofolate cyclodeaminase